MRKTGANADGGREWPGQWSGGSERHHLPQFVILERGSLCRPGWPGPLRDPPASVSSVLGLTESTPTPGRIPCSFEEKKREGEGNFRGWISGNSGFGSPCLQLVGAGL